MVPSFSLLPSESSGSVNENPDRKKLEMIQCSVSLNHRITCGIPPTLILVQKTIATRNTQSFYLLKLIPQRISVHLKVQRSFFKNLLY